MKKLWNIKFCALPDGEKITVESGEKTAVSVSFENGKAIVSAWFSFRPNPLILSCEAQTGDELIINYLDYKIELYKNELLEDEEWCAGICILDDAVCGSLDVTITYEPYIPAKNTNPLTFTGIQGWKPSGHNVHVGDCMPFSDISGKEIFHLFYLFDRRGHGSKWGLGAHQWAHVSSSDLINWTPHPMAVGIDKQEEGSICTGSIIAHNGKYYAFYAVRTNDSSPAKLTWSVSDDCIHFEKSGKTFELSEPYHASSARDPKAFVGDDGNVHLFITTSINLDGKWKGCLAHVVSSSPESNEWTAVEPAAILNIEDQPECTDYFYYNGLYYLIYSNYGTARYFVSENPMGPWCNPVESGENIIVGSFYRVPKSAVFKGEIIFAGFIIDSDVGWGGTVRLYKAVPEESGKLIFIEL